MKKKIQKGNSKIQEESKDHESFVFALLVSCPTTISLLVNDDNEIRAMILKKGSPGDPSRCPSPFFRRLEAAELGSTPEAAARIAAMRCLARSSPWSAALTYQTLASRGSRRHPMPISVK